MLELLVIDRFQSRVHIIKIDQPTKFQLLTMSKLNTAIITAVIYDRNGLDVS